MQKRGLRSGHSGEDVHYRRAGAGLRPLRQRGIRAGAVSAAMKTAWPPGSPAAIAMIMRKRARYALVRAEAGVEQWHKNTYRVCSKTQNRKAQKHKILIDIGCIIGYNH